MTPQHRFGLIVRTFGLYLALKGLYFFATTLYILALPSIRPHSPPSSYVIYGVIYGVLSPYLLRGAPGLIGFCYPRSSEGDNLP